MQHCFHELLTERPCGATLWREIVERHSGNLKERWNVTSNSHIKS